MVVMDWGGLFALEAVLDKAPHKESSFAGRLQGNW